MRSPLAPVAVIVLFSLAALVACGGGQDAAAPAPDALRASVLLSCLLAAGGAFGLGRHLGLSAAGSLLALLLLSKAGAKRSGDSLEVGLETLREVLCLLSTAVDREIVNRMLQRQDATPIGTELMRGLQILVQHAKEQADSACHA